MSGRGPRAARPLGTGPGAHVPAGRVTALTESHTARNRRAWDYLASVRSSASQPWPSVTPELARSWLDEFGWLPWDELRRVLVLCGAGGQQAPALAALGLDVTLVDNSPRQLDVDRRVAARRGLSIECVQADAEDLSAVLDRTFDLVYQPVSTCYLADPRACYRNVAAVLRPGGLYLSDHWNPVQMQLDDRRWDGAGYRLTRRAGTGEALRIVDPSTVDGPDCAYFAHRLADLLGGICDAGFVIERFGERGAADPDAEPGSSEHLGAYVAPFFEVLARRVVPVGPPPPARDGHRPPALRRRGRDPATLQARWRSQGFLTLRGELDPHRLVPALSAEWREQRQWAVESAWDEYGVSDDGSYVSGGMRFRSAPPGHELAALHRSPALTSLVRAVTGDAGLVPSENVAYMYYDDGSYIDVHTDVPECELTVLTGVHGGVPPLVAYPRLRDAAPAQLLRAARRSRGRPSGGTRLAVPHGGLLLLDGRRLPHRRPVLRGARVGLAALCFVRAATG